MADSDEASPRSPPPPALLDEDVVMGLQGNKTRRRAKSRLGGTESDLGRQMEREIAREMEKNSLEDMERLRKRFDASGEERKANSNGPPNKLSRHQRDSYIEPLGPTTSRPQANTMGKHPQVFISYRDDEGDYVSQPFSRRGRSTVAAESNAAADEAMDSREVEYRAAIREQRGEVRQARVRELEEAAAADAAELEAREVALQRAAEEAKYRMKFEAEAELKAKKEARAKLQARIEEGVMKMKDTWEREKDELERERNMLKAEESNLRRENAVLRAEKLAIEREKRALEKASRMSTAVSEKAKLRVEWVSWKSLDINSWTKPSGR